MSSKGTSALRMALRCQQRCCSTAGRRIRRVRVQTTTAAARASSTQSRRFESSSSSDREALLFAAAAAAGLAIVSGAVETHDPQNTVVRDNDSNDVALGELLKTAATSVSQRQQPTVVNCDPRRPTQQRRGSGGNGGGLGGAGTKQEPRNVMLHRMRSMRGRGLNEKYKVDWKQVLGEGAYGSVHPARLAATGEKVRKMIIRFRLSFSFFVCLLSSILLAKMAFLFVSQLSAPISSFCALLTIEQSRRALYFCSITWLQTETKMHRLH